MDREYDFETLARTQAGTKLVGTRVSEGRLRPPYHIIHDGRNVGVLDNYREGLSLGAIVEAYGEVYSQDDWSEIPIEIALDGNTAIATYLHGVHELPREKIAEIMDVEEVTITEYLRRFRPEYEWGT